MNAPTANQLEEQVVQLANQGRGSWRKPRTNLDVLRRAPLIGEKLAATAASDSDADSIWKAVEDGIVAAIETLPDPFRSAAKAQFGLSAPKGAMWALPERRKKAAKCLNYSLSWYRKKQAELGGVDGERYIARLVTFALLGEADPVGWLRSRTPPGDGLTVAAPQAGQLSTAMLTATYDELQRWDFRPAHRRANQSREEYQRIHGLRVCLDGPTFLHPDFYFDAYLSGQWEYDDGGDARINEFVRRHLRASCSERNPHVRIVLRNAPPDESAYVKRILRLIGSPADTEDFFGSCLDRVNEIWGTDADRGPDLICGSTTDYDAGVITSDASLLPFADSWVLGARIQDPAMPATTLLPQSQDHAPKQPPSLAQLRADFDATFDSEYVGQMEARAQLIGYLEQLRRALGKGAAVAKT